MTATEKAFHKAVCDLTGKNGINGATIDQALRSAPTADVERK